MDARSKAALEYHTTGRPGKIEVIPTKALNTERELSLAYSPGVAAPCLVIREEPDAVFKYTAPGNLVAVVSNGTAVLGLGNIGPGLVSANSAYKLLVELGGAEVVGPILLGMRHPVHFFQRGATVPDIINLVTLASVDAQASSEQPAEAVE